MRPAGSPEALAVRRRLAVSMLLKGHEVAAVAEAVEVDASSVRRWRSCYERRGESGLAAVAVAGRPPKLTAGQREQVLSWVREGKATDFGFDTPRWTAPRVAAVLQRRFGVSLHPHYLNDWLGRQGISPQLPQRLPRERDPKEIDRWLRKDWPRIKRGLVGRAQPSSSPMKAGF
ncbi:MAG: winged helix-turn-helix domain-containing protein [Bacillota bacterium]